MNRVATRSEPVHCEMDTRRVDGVKPPQHRDAPRRLMKKMTQATDLIGGLSGEQKRWTEDANGFASEKLRLVGDCAVACAFVSYCGPFNQEYRSYCIVDKYSNECETRHVPVTQNLNIIEFLADIGTIGDWNQVRDSA